ncbi:hypothetical protein [Gordonia sp. (in: high G+C Gram-positive bacteria)]|uniref:hypothetical protein n=1 Tax=Gordonia sp. (in: high G+C Gram-positive bacteria) TaxID=84139 RepID=UPI0039E46F87
MSRSSGPIEVMLPAPRTRPTPPDTPVSRAPSPTSARTVSSSTPGCVQTSAEKPLNSSVCCRSSGSTCQARRFPGRFSGEIGSSGDAPRASAASEWATVPKPARVAYGPDSHSSPSSEESGASPLISAAVSAHSCATGAIASWVAAISAARSPRLIAAQACAPEVSAVTASS